VRHRLCNGGVRMLSLPACPAMHDSLPWNARARGVQKQRRSGSFGADAGNRRSGSRGRWAQAPARAVISSRLRCWQILVACSLSLGTECDQPLCFVLCIYDTDASSFFHSFSLQGERRALLEIAFHSEATRAGLMITQLCTVHKIDVYPNTKCQQREQQQSGAAVTHTVRYVPDVRITASLYVRS